MERRNNWELRSYLAPLRITCLGRSTPPAIGTVFAHSNIGGRRFESHIKHGCLSRFIRVCAIYQRVFMFVLSCIVAASQRADPPPK
jgi:hypothetical protein